MGRPAARTELDDWRQRSPPMAVDKQMQQMSTVRQVTEVRGARSEEKPGEPGMYSFQLTLDNGADEYIIVTQPEDASALLRMFQAGSAATFDKEKKLLKFGTLAVSAAQ
jgi:hypothetical protein